MSERITRATRGENATYRELKAAEEALVKRMSAIEMEQASQRAALQHVPEDLRRLADAVNGLAQRMPERAPQSDQALLAIQRTLDVLSKQPPPQSGIREVAELLKAQPAQGGGKTWALVGALGVVAVMLGWQILIGG